MTTSKRHLLAKGKGYFNAAGPQARFIIFLIAVLATYTFILKVFQKLAEILDFPLFFPITLVILFIFISIVGTVYSHKFVGPMSRIRKAIEQLAGGDATVSLRLRESDDPMLKDLVTAIGRLCEHSRDTHSLLQEAAKDLFADIAALQEKIRLGAETAEIRKQMDGVRKKQDLLDKAVKSFGKS